MTDSSFQPYFMPSTPLFGATSSSAVVGVAVASELDLSASASAVGAAPMQLSAMTLAMTTDDASPPSSPDSEPFGLEHTAAKGVADRFTLQPASATASASSSSSAEDSTMHDVTVSTTLSGSRSRKRSRSPEDEEALDDEAAIAPTAAKKPRASTSRKSRAGGGGGRSRGKKGAAAAAAAASGANAGAAGGEGHEDTQRYQALKEMQAQRERTLARKAELARISRRRQKDRLAELERQVEQLTEQLDLERSRSANFTPIPSPAPNSPDSSAPSSPVAGAAPSPQPASQPMQGAAPVACTCGEPNCPYAAAALAQLQASGHVTIKQEPGAAPSSSMAMPPSFALSPLAAPVVPALPSLDDIVQQAIACGKSGKAGGAAASTAADGKDSKSGGGDTKEVDALMDSFLNVLNTRTKLIESQVAPLEKLLEPCQPVRFLEWLLTQPDRFYVDPNGLFSQLCRVELKLSKDQLQALMGMRAELVEQKKAATELRLQALGVQPLLLSSLGPSAIEALPKFVASTMSLQQSFQAFSQLARAQEAHSLANLGKLRAILSTAQMVAFLAWVSKNGALCLSING